MKNLLKATLVTIAIFTIWLILSHSLIGGGQNAEDTATGRSPAPSANDCQAVGVAYRTAMQRFNALLSAADAPAESMGLVFQNIGEEASVQVIYSPFEGDDPGDRFVIAVNESSMSEAVNTFVRTPSNTPFYEQKQNQEVSDYYCNALGAIRQIGTDDDHIAIKFFVTEEARTSTIEYAPDTHEQEAFTWDIQRENDENNTGDLTQKLCDRLSTEFDEWQVDVSDWCLVRNS